MLKTLSCPYGSVSSCNGELKTAFRRKDSVVSFPRVRVPVRICYHASKSCGIGWSRWMGEEEVLDNQCIRSRPGVLKVEPTRWSTDVARSGMFCTPSDSNTWLRKFLKLDRSHAEEGDSQKTAVVDVHVRLSLSRPRNFADSVSKLTPRWFRLLKGVNPSLPHHGGGGNRDGDFSIRLGYGGDDEGKGSNKGLLFLTWWAAGVPLMSALVWALGYYSGIPHRTQFAVPQFVDCVVWLGLAWCLAAVFLWAARMVVSLTPASQDYGKLFRSRNGAFSSGLREFVLKSKVDEWMAQNVVAVPGLVISLFLVCDLIHYGTKVINISNLVARVKSEVSRVSEFFKSRVGEATTKRGSLFSRGSSDKRGRRGTLFSSKRRRS